MCAAASRQNLPVLLSLFWLPFLFSQFSLPARSQDLWEGLLLPTSGRGLLDVLAVLDGAGQLCVESGVSCAATCSLGNGGAREETRLRGVLREQGTVFRST
jgi:hypothetical protein